MTRHTELTETCDDGTSPVAAQSEAKRAYNRRKKKAQRQAKRLQAFGGARSPTVPGSASTSTGPADAASEGRTQLAQLMHTRMQQLRARRQPAASKRGGQEDEDDDEKVAAFYEAFLRQEMGDAQFEDAAYEQYANDPNNGPWPPWLIEKHLRKILGDEAFEAEMTTALVAAAQKTHHAWRRLARHAQHVAAVRWHRFELKVDRFSLEQTEKNAEASHQQALVRQRARQAALLRAERPTRQKIALRESHFTPLQSS